MTVRTALLKVVMQEDLNFLLTNRIPRLALARFMGKFSKVEHPLVARTSIALWRLFSDVDLSDAAQERYPSLHAAFVRCLRPDARPFVSDPDTVASPCDAIVGAHGTIESGRLHQIKGFPYSLADLVGDGADAEPFLDGTYVTLRLTAGMYHRFHAPHDLVVEHVRYISGDTWNVNPIALRRIERLFCKNERAPIRVRFEPHGQPFMLVPIAAVLVASIRLPFVDARAIRVEGARCISLAHRFARGEEMGWFEHGSTIVLLTTPGFRMVPALHEGARVYAGSPLLQFSDN